MGSLTYDGLTVQLDDRTLAHLQIVLVQKLRRGESFLMSWKDSGDVGDGRSAIWVHPTIPIRFKFTGSKVPAINEEWLNQLVTSANSSRGLVLTEENGSMSAPKAKESWAHPQPTTVDQRQQS